MEVFCLLSLQQVTAESPRGHLQLEKVPQAASAPWTAVFYLNRLQGGCVARGLLLSVCLSSSGAHLLPPQEGRVAFQRGFAFLQNGTGGDGWPDVLQDSPVGSPRAGRGEEGY